jgi:hypothetical protein
MNEDIGTVTVTPFQSQKTLCISVKFLKDNQLHRYLKNQDVYGIKPKAVAIAVTTVWFYSIDIFAKILPPTKTFSFRYDCLCSETGLPDFSWCNKPKRVKMYQSGENYTKRPEN